MKLELTYFIYEQHLEPRGLLPRMFKRESSACWHFCKLAMQVLEKVPEQATYEGELDKTVRLRTIAESVAKLYLIDDLNDMMRFYLPCLREAFRCGLPWDDRLKAFFDSAGRAYDEVTREPGRLNHE